MTCVNNPIDGKESVLYGELLKVLGTEELAKDAIKKVSSPVFLEKFGNWIVDGQTEYDQEGNPEVAPKHTYENRLQDNGEPKIKSTDIVYRGDTIKEYYFEDSNGGFIWLNKVMFPKMTPNEVNEVTNQLIYEFITTEKNTSYNDAEGMNVPDWDKLEGSIQKSMEIYLKQNPEHADKVATVIEYKKEFASEVREKLQQDGYNYYDKQSQKLIERLNEDGSPLGDMTEEDKSQPLNIAENFSVSSKESASNNTKLFLSMLPAMEHVTNPDTGKREVVEKMGNYLNRTQFVEMDEVWGTLQPLLTDIVGVGDETGSTQDVLSLMIDKISTLDGVKPWSYVLKAELEVLRDSQTNRALEFVQAFTKARLNFHVTEYNQDSGTYTVINATSTNSKASQIRGKWTDGFKDGWIKNGTIIPELLDEYHANLNNWNQVKSKFKSDGKLAKAQGHPNPLAFALKENMAGITSGLAAFGIQFNGNDMNSFIFLHGRKNAYHNINEMFNRIGSKFGVIANKSLVVDGEFQSPMDEEKIIQMLAQAKGMSVPDMSENTIMMNKGKTAWTYSTPSYLHNTINKLKADPKAITEKNAIPFNRNSLWAKYMGATEVDKQGEDRFNSKERATISADRMDGVSISLGSSFKSKGLNDGVDTKEIKKVDATGDAINKMLGESKPIFPTMIAADKSKKMEINGMPYFDSKSDIDNGEYRITDATLDVFIGYFNDEYNRMEKVWKDIETLPEEQLIDHYHKGRLNGTKSQLFPGLSYDVLKDAKLKDALYQEGGRPVTKSTKDFTPGQLELLKPQIERLLRNAIKESEQQLIDSSVITVELDGTISKSAIGTNVLKKYKGKNDPNRAIIGDFTINGIIANVEYGKIFSGDPAFYKNTIDMLKRIPGTYTDGLQLALDTHTDTIMNVAIISDVNEQSLGYSEIYRSLVDKKLAKAYKEVNTTDAQAWITPKRWRFLMTRLGKWTPVHDSAYKKMINGQQLGKAEQKKVMQPMKGVYFGMDSKGQPTYLKYSQAVIWPSLVAGSPMEALYNKMTKDPATGEDHAKPYNEVHEVITVSGIKVGAVGESAIHSPGTTDIVAEKDLVLNKVRLNNRNWKLQQDLPTKLAKQTNVGSQIQKNILDQLFHSKGKFQFNGQEYTGKEMHQMINDTVSDLSNKGVADLKEKFGIEEDNKISNTEELYNAMIREFTGKKADENVLAALRKRLPFDAIPQLGNKIESTFMSMMNKEIVKIQTNGGSYIQVSPFGIEHVSSKSDIKIISDSFDPKKGLLPPRKKQVTINGKKKTVVLPGQALLPHYALTGPIKQAIKAGRLHKGTNLANIDKKILKEILDETAKQLVSYRIPNQGMSSNDALEIVGILPEGMGDSIIGYDGIPGKTGSDFDIDKSFVMFPNLEYNEDAGKIQKKSSEGTGKHAMQNKLFDLYTSILTAPSTYDNMMKSIDSTVIKDDIDDLAPESQMRSLQLFTPTQQIETKFEYMSGKFGVAQTANQLVDHISSQAIGLSLAGNLGVGNTTNEGSTLFDKVYATDGSKIADTLSEFLNAYVDIAKDPYISRGNHNNMTANTTFMLIRAGVPVTWVNRLMLQPIIVKYIELKKQQEGITAKPLTFDGKMVTVDKYMELEYGVSDYAISAEQIGKTTESRLEHNIRQKSIAAGNEDLMKDAFAMFKKFEGYGKKLGTQVQASKADTQGATGSFVGRIVLANKIQQVLMDGTLQGFDEKIKGDTMIATYTSNAVDWIGEVGSASEIFISAHRGTEHLMDTVSGLIDGRDTLLNEDLGKKIESALGSYNYSKLPIFNRITKAEYKDLYTELPNRLREYKNSHPDNFFTDNLNLKFNNNRNFIKIDNKDKPKTYNDYMYRTWSAMLRSTDAKEKQLGEDLVRYAFYQSGFKYNINEFFSYIPHEYLLEQGIVDSVKATTRIAQDMNVDGEFIDQFLRHNSEDTDLVPKVPLSKLKDGKIGDVPGMGGFYLDSDTSPEHVLKRGTDKETASFPLFVQVHTKDQFGTVKKRLYKQVGAKRVADKVDRVVYARTFKLGDKQNHGGVVEYTYGEKTNVSVVPYNNLSKDVNEASKNARANADFILTQAPDAPQEQRFSNQETETIEKFEEKVEDFKSRIDAEVIIDPDVPTSRLLAANDPRSIAAGKPVILINPDAVFNDTIPHEFGHIFIDLLPNGLKNPRVVKALKQLEGTSLWNEVKAAYPDLKEDLFHKEVLATAIGREGAQIWSDKEEQSRFRAFINWVFSYFKRKLGLDRDSVRSLANELMTTSMDTKAYATEHYMEQKTQKETKELSDLDRTYNSILTRISNLKEELTPRSRKEKQVQKNANAMNETTAYSRTSQLHQEIKDLENVDHKRAIIKYVLWADGVIENQIRSINSEEAELKALEAIMNPKQIRKYRDHLNALGGVPAVIQLISDEVSTGNMPKKQGDRLLKSMRGILGKIENVESQLLSHAKNNYVETMVNNGTQHDAKWTSKFSQDFDTMSPSGYTRSQYIVEQMNTHRVEIDAEARAYFRTRVNEADSDITSGSMLFFSEKNINSSEIQTASKLLDAVDQQVDIFATTAAAEMQIAFDKFSKRAKGVSNFDKYGKFLETTEDNGHYLINEYSVGYMLEEKESNSWLDPAVAEEKYKNATYTNSGYTLEGETVEKRFKMPGGKIVGEFWVPFKKSIPPSPIREAIGISERREWTEKNQVKVPVAQGGTRTFPTDNWKNPDWKELSLEDQKDLAALKASAKKADEDYDKRSSLITKKGSMEFIRLPGILKSDLDRVLSGDVKGLAEDKFKDLSRVREDEFEYGDKDGRLDDKDTKRVKADVSNNERFSVPVPYRAILSKADQSFDLHSIFLLNRVQSRNHALKTEVDDTFGVLIEVMKERSHAQLTGLGRKQNIHGWSTDKLIKVFKPMDATKQDVQKLISMREQRVYGIHNKGSVQAHKATSALLKASGTTALLLNFAAEQVNLATGTVSNIVEAIGGETYSMRDRKIAGKKYYRDLKNIMNDVGSNVQRSKTNLLINAFNTLGDRNFLNNKFEESNRVKSLGKLNTLRFVATAGEHMMQAKVMYSILNSIKVINDKGEYLDVNGKVTKNKNDAATLDEVMEFHDKRGVSTVKLPDWVQATTHTLSGGQDKIMLETRSLIKKKIIDLHGLYDGDIQNAAQREWWGKAMFFLRKWMVSTTLRRWRGASTMLKKNEDMREVDKFFSEDMKAYQEGYYATAVRFIRHTLPLAARSGGLEGVKKGFEDLSKMEKANLKKAMVELGIVTLTAMLYAGIGEEGEDEWLGLRARYLLRREMSELLFYLSPMESFKIAATPSASMGYIEKMLRLFAQSFDPTAVYEQGYNKGRSKWLKKGADLVPVWAQAQKDIQGSLDYLKW